MTIKKELQPFVFSTKSRASLEAIFAGQPHAKSFLAAAQRIVGNHVSVMSDFSGLPPATTLRANARSIATAARTLLDCVAALSEEEAELFGQFMWIADKINYYPGASSVQRSAETILVIRQAAQQLALSGRKGRRGLRLDGLIRELHAGYVLHFRARPAVSVARDTKFVAALRICLAEAGISRPTKLLQVMRAALGKTKSS